ncbi:MAG: hypothetical protein ACOYJO_07010 [Eubacterium sp.]|jgi:hypothetical protein
MEDKKPTLEEFKKMVYDYYVENFSRNHPARAKQYLSEKESQEAIEEMYNSPISCYDADGNLYVSYEYTASAIAGCLVELY